MSMKIGLCVYRTIVDNATIAKDAGFDYIEGTVDDILKPLELEEEFLPVLEEIKQSPLPCLALNGFIPAHLKVTGPDANLAALEAYCMTAFERAQRAGIPIIVFGSGGARKVPEGWGHERALAQIVEFLRLVAPEARRRGVTVAIEPLFSRATNIINTMAEGAAVAREVDEPAIRLLVDSSHWAAEPEPSVTDILAAADLLVHAHISTYKNRLFPGMEPEDFTPFLSALRDANYAGGLSIEADGERSPETLRTACTIFTPFPAPTYLNRCGRDSEINYIYNHTAFV